MEMAFEESQKKDIVNRYQNGAPVAALSTETGIAKSTIYSWIKAYEDELLNAPASRRDYSMLMQRFARLENMVKILKTVKCTVSSPLKEKLHSIESLHGEFSVHLLCDALEVSRGTYYNHIFRNKRDNTTYARNREQLQTLIRDIFDENHQIFGANKVRAVLAEQGYNVSDKMVAELMREMKLHSVNTTSKREYTKWQKGENPNILQQQFHAERPNQVWVSDISVFKYGGQYYHICIIIDLYSRKVVAYRIGRQSSTQLITKTFRAATSFRKPESGLLFHSDRGPAYVSFAFQRLLNEHGAVHSFSRSGRPHDNAVAESFFASLKKEELYRRRYKSESDFLRAIGECIKFYNGKRPHASLQYKTPDQMETPALGMPF